MKNINRKAPVQNTCTLLIKASPVKVWAALTGINEWGDWQTEITTPRLNGELKPGTTFDWVTGGMKIHSTLHTVEPYTDFGWTGKALGTLAVHNWKLKEVNGQTQVTVEESMEGFIAGLLRKRLTKSVEKGMRVWLDLLKKQCER